MRAAVAEPSPVRSAYRLLMSSSRPILTTPSEIFAAGFCAWPSGLAQRIATVSATTARARLMNTLLLMACYAVGDGKTRYRPCLPGSAQESLIDRGRALA